MVGRHVKIVELFDLHFSITIKKIVKDNIRGNNQN